MNRLKELRQEKKLSQKELANVLEFPLRTYQRMENGESQIKPDKAQQLAEYFGVSVGYLLGFSDSSSTYEEFLETEKGFFATVMSVLFPHLSIRDFNSIYQMARGLDSGNEALTRLTREYKKSDSLLVEIIDGKELNNKFYGKLDNLLKEYLEESGVK